MQSVLEKSYPIFDLIFQKFFHNWTVLKTFTYWSALVILT